jgi:hypothetical protein
VSRGGYRGVAQGKALTSAPPTCEDLHCRESRNIDLKHFIKDNILL